VDSALVVFVIMVLVAVVTFLVCGKIFDLGEDSKLYESPRSVNLIVNMLFGLGGLVLILSFGSVGVASFDSNQKVGYLMERVEKSATAVEMTSNLNLLLQVMEENGLTDGQTNFLFPTPNSDLAVLYSHVQVVRDRAAAVSAIPDNTGDYALAMQDLRVAVDGIDTRAADAFFLRLDYPVYAFGLWVVMMFLIVFGFVLEKFLYTRRIRSHWSHNH